MSAVVNLDLASMRNLTSRAAWATPDDGLAREQLPQDLPEGVDLENESEEGVDVEEENHWEPGRIRVPRRLVWGIIILLGLVMAALALWGVAHSTWWY
jgi:hypothetical protein